MRDNETAKNLIEGKYMPKACHDCPWRRDISQHNHPDPRSMMYVEDEMTGNTESRIIHLFQCHNNRDRTCAGALTFAKSIGVPVPEGFQQDERCFKSQEEVDEFYRPLYGSEPKRKY